MLKCIIVDDEERSRLSLKILVQDFCDDVEVVALCASVDEALTAIEEQRPHILFLDIQMDGETGFDLLERIKNIDFEIIFTTAYTEFALKAIKFSAIDYLLKPIDTEELKSAVDKVEKRVNGSVTTRLENLVQNLKANTNNQRFKLALPSSEGLVFVKVDDIMYCEASSNYTVIYLMDGKSHIVSRTLKEYEDLLGDQNFFRIHKSYLINLNAIKKYVRGDGGYVVMNNDKSLDVAKRKKDEFLSRIG